MKSDELLEKLSMTLPFGLGRAHARAIARLFDGNAHTCLDIGCGRGAFQLLRKYESVGCDIYPPNLQIAKSKGYYRDVLRCDVRDLPFAPGSFDTVLCLEVIEHMSKKEGTALVRRMEEVARRQVIITTPWGYFPIEERQDNPHLAHVSGWVPAEFEEMGYRVYPFYYPRYPGGSKHWQVLARYLIAPFAYPVVRANPQKWAQDLVAVKKLG